MKKTVEVNNQKITRESHLFSGEKNCAPNTKNVGKVRVVEKINGYHKVSWHEKK